MGFFVSKRRVLTVAMYGTLAACAEQDQTATDLITAFKSSCSTWGAWSDGAQAQTQSLITTLNNLKASQAQACSSIGATIDSINNLASAAHGVFGDPGYLAYQQKQEELQELMLTLGKVQDGDLQEAVKLALVSTQVDLAKARADAAATKSATDDKIGIDDRYSLATRQLASDFSSLYSQSAQLTNCLHANPSAALQLGSSLLGVGGSFVSPIAGAAAYVVGQLMAITVEAIRNYPVDDAVWKLYGAQMPGALTCGMDAMETYYCQAEDSYKILQNNARQYPSNGAPPEEFWKGLDVLSRRLPVLNNWLLEVKGGVLPENPTDAQRIIDVLQKFNMLETRNYQVIGELNQGITLSKKAPDDGTRRNYLIQYVKNIISDLESGAMSGQTSNDPFIEFSTSSRNFACWLTLGYRAPETCPKPRDVDESTEDYINGELLTAFPGASLDYVLSTGWPSLLTQVSNKVNIEFSDAIFIDPAALIAKGAEPLTSGDSPLRTLQMIADFLHTFRDRSAAAGKTSRLALIDESEQIVQAAIDILQGRNPVMPPQLLVPHKSDAALSMLNDPPTDPQPATNPLANLFSIFQLKNGTQFFNKRLSLFVEWDLQDRFHNNELPGDINQILLQAGGEIHQRLLASGLNNYDDMAADLDNARALSRSNLDVFGSFFGEAIGRSVRELWDQAQKQEGGISGPDRIISQNLARLCLVVISAADKWNDKVSWDICSRQELYSVQPDPDNTLKVNLTALKQALDAQADPLAKRYDQRCAFYKFRRASRIAQILRGQGKLLNEPRLMNIDFNRLLSELMSDGRPL